MLSDHSCFGPYLRRKRKEATLRCWYCPTGEDTAQHALEVCSVWAGERCLLVGLIGGNLLLPGMVRAMLDSEQNWITVVSFCERVM